MKEIFQKKQFKLILACISLLMLIDLIQDTYAKYVTSADTNANFTVAKWAFVVNTQEILSNSTYQNLIVPTIDTNPNITAIPRCHKSN